MTSWRRSSSAGAPSWRLEVFRYAVLAFASVIVIKLFILQIVDHSYYQALASGQYEMFKELFPVRGDILFQDLKDERVVPVATNERLAFIYSDPRLIENSQETAYALADIFGYTDELREELVIRLDRRDDPFEPIEHRVSDELLEKVVERKLSGVSYTRELIRIYPEKEMGGHVIGFLGSNDDGTLSGKYGIEGFFNDELAGKPGFLRSDRDIAGRLIAVGNRSLEKATDGADIVLTIDRTIQYTACTALERAVSKHGASGGSVVILEPSSGKVLAMCSAPDFHPALYRDVASIDQFNNPAIFDSYEPGSVFKPITMAAGLDAEAVLPTTTFEDIGSVKVGGWRKPLGNAEGKSYGVVDMTRVLEDSINTGMVFVMRKMGGESFVNYIKAFGFGTKTGIELETEVAGDVSSLDEDSEIYKATASFGQGITVTPLQIAAAYAAIANGGVLKTPYIVDEIRNADGSVEKHAPRDVRQVIAEKTARLLGAMLISVVEHGHGRRAGVPGYYIAGKTGTAQVAREGGIGYDPDNTIGSFAGFGPAEAPKFAMVVRIDNPRDVVWAESTAAPLFGEIASFLMQYFEVAPSRSI